MEITLEKINERSGPISDLLGFNICTQNYAHVSG